MTLNDALKSTVHVGAPQPGEWNRMEQNGTVESDCHVLRSDRSPRNDVWGGPAQSVRAEALEVRTDIRPSNQRCLAWNELRRRNRFFAICGGNVILSAEKNLAFVSLGYAANPFVLRLSKDGRVAPSVGLERGCP